MCSKFCVKFQRAHLKFHMKFWSCTLQNIYFTYFHFLCDLWYLWIVTSLDLVRWSLGLSEGGVLEVGFQALENPMGPLWNFNWGPNGLEKIMIYFCGGILQNLLENLKIPHGTGPGPSTKIFTESPQQTKKCLRKRVRSDLNSLRPSEAYMRQ